MATLCSHPLIQDSTVADALWHAPPQTCRDIAAAGGTLLPAAVSWVSAQVGANRRDWKMSPDQRNQIAAVESRWAAWCGNDPARAAFLRNASLAFTSEEALFAAGDAITAPPAHTTTDAAGR